MRRTTRRIGPMTASAVVACLAIASCNGGGDDPVATDAPDDTAEPTDDGEEPADSTPTDDGETTDEPTAEPASEGDRMSVVDGGVVEPWSYVGWSATVDDTSVELDLGDWGGMILVAEELPGSYKEIGIVIADDVPVDDRGFLRVQLGDGFGSSYPVEVVEFEESDGSLRAVVPTVELLGGLGSFNTVTLSAADLYDVPSTIRIEEVYLVEGDPRDDLDLQIADHDATVDCVSEGLPISEHIYGFSRTLIDGDPSTFEMNPGSRRWGGNSTSRYNPEIGAWNLAYDYYWQNIDISGDELAHETFLRLNGENGVQSAMTVPMIGWVAKDDSSYTFPISVYGDQLDADPDNPDIGNGITLDGEEIEPPVQTTTSVAWTPADVAAWVTSMQEYAASRGEPEPFMYFLDNEPMLWYITHRDVSREPLGYDELLDRSIAYGSAIREAAPDALIAGPSVWGWPAYFYSAIDAEDDNFNDTPDRRAHGGVPLIEWYLQQMAAYEEETGVRLLDVLDIHFYPQDGSYPDGIDAEDRARRLRSTRSLWDGNYSEESWIDQPVDLIPRMQEWVDENYPGTKLSLGEYSFGAYQDITGGLAQAEALGRFGQNGLFSAYFWWEQSIFESPANTPVYWAFRAYRNYDGDGGRFGDISLPTDSKRPVSVFASADSERDENVLVLVNISDDEQLETGVELIGCDRSESVAYQYVGNPAGFEPVASSLEEDQLKITLPPYSITVVELR